MSEAQARNLVNSAALVVAAIYFYRKLIEPAASHGNALSASPAPDGAEEVAGDSQSRAVFERFRGPHGSFIGFDQDGEPTTVTGAAAQLLGEGKPASTERFIVGWGFVFLTLSLAVPLSPQLAGSFAALIALGSILANGSQVSKDIRTQLRSGRKTRSGLQGSTAAPTTMVSFAGAQAPPALVSQGKKKNTPAKYKLSSA